MHDAINNYTSDYPRLIGHGPFLAIGGGDEKGAFDLDSVLRIINDLPRVPTEGYSGIVFDIEIVPCVVVVIQPQFAKMFATAKSLNLTVVVATSHSAPKSTIMPADGVDFIKAWTNDSNIDIISPKLFETGTETIPNFSETASCDGCTWDLFKDSKA